MKSARTRYFSPRIDKHFAKWILKETWFTNHGADEERFHEFVLAVHKYSKPVGRKRGEGKWIRHKEGFLTESVARNPRTYDRKLLEKKICKAVRQNHSFHEQELDRLAADFSGRAIKLLDFMWDTRNGLSDLTKWDPPLQ